ncbi:hypothetical protein L3Q82_023411 [Scortum barcoo]|uniref:Uncharacterized protein n=1 Tax=Scortum barcoo TaxID=214431 RepID=A0ACB8WY68_9TELE|nr:hypothetical protein L3Q82_023411 [Scortum barcoo]
MFHVKDSRSFNFTVLVFHTVVFFVLIHSCGGQSQVVGPSQPIVATVGEDVVLPCYLDPVVNAFDWTVEWARPDLNPKYILRRRHGAEMENKKHPSYEGRTSMFIDELQHGNVSLKLSKVKISDEGTYRCFIIDLDRSSNVQLVVGAASSPVIQEATEVSGQLQCESGGWYPEPEVSWLDGEGRLLPAGPAETVRGPDDGLFTISSRVTVEKKHGNNFTCRVQQKNIQQTREAHVLVPDHFFVVSSPPSPPDTSDGPHVIIASVTVCAALVFLAVVFFVVWKRRQKNFRNTRRSCEDGAEEERTDSSAGDNSGLLVVMERERERAPLMAGREEENNVDSRGEEKIESQSERQDLFVKNQQPERRRHVDGTDGEREEKSVNDEREALSPTEGQTHQQQDMRGRNDKDEGEQTMDSGPPIKLMTGGQNIDQEVTKEEETQKDLDTNKKETKLEEEKEKNQVKKEEETRQEPMKDVDKKETNVKGKKPKKEREQERGRKGGSESTGKKKQENQREEMKDEAEGQKMETRKEREKDLLVKQKQQRSAAEDEDEKEKDQKEKQKVENQKEEINENMKREERMKNERKLQADEKREEEIKLKTQKGDVKYVDTNKKETKLENETGKNEEQRNTAMTEKKNCRMFHVKDSRSFNFTVLVFHTVVFFVLIHSCGGQSQVVGPSQPIVATVVSLLFKAPLSYFFGHFQVLRPHLSSRRPQKSVDSYSVSLEAGIRSRRCRGWTVRDASSSAGPAETVRGPDGLFTAISSRVTVEKKHGNNFTCRVQQKNIQQTREAHVLVPGKDH